MNRRTTLFVVFAGVLVAASVAGFFGLRPRSSPARELFRTTLPAWQAARFQPSGGVGSMEAKALLRAAAPWPALRTELGRIDEAWPDEPSLRAATDAANEAARSAGLAYFIDVQHVRDQPILLTYEIAERLRFRAGAREVEALHVRRLDSLNVELAMLGETQSERPRVLLDRIEASLAHDLPLMFQKPDAAGGRPASEVPQNAIDRAAFARLREHLELRLGAGPLAAAVERLGRRDALVEAMRSRLRGGTVQLARPDGFVLGPEWVERMEPYTRLGQAGGPLLLASDLREVAHADEELRDGPDAEVLRRAVDLVADATDIHEVRHALDGKPPPAPPLLRALFSENDERFPKMASLELRAYLAELHHGPLPPCVTVAKLVRTVFGASARRTPHFYASYVILRHLGEPEAAPPESPTDAPLDPAARLGTLCGRPEEALRTQAGKLWQRLYGEPLLPIIKLAAPR